MPDMTPTFLSVLRRQFDPSLQMLADVMRACPEAVWSARAYGNPFWQQVLHALAGIQFWFRESREEFSPPDFGRGPVPDLDRIPEFNVDRKTVEDYLNALRERVDSFFGSLDDSRLLSTSTLYDKCTYADLILMQVRHIQHHVGYLNCVLRAAGAGTVTWRGYAE